MFGGVTSSFGLFGYLLGLHCVRGQMSVVKSHGGRWDKGRHDPGRLPHGVKPDIRKRL
jgi:hypothetical protein